MRKVFLFLLVLCFIVALAVPSQAQLINWNRRNNQKPAGPPTTQVAPRQTTGYMEVTGTILGIDKRNNQITIRDNADYSRKEFMVVDPRTLDSLRRYQRVVITFRRGSKIAASVKVVK